MSATIIGQVAVKVIPDTGDFRKDAKRELGAIEKALDKVKIGFEADTEQAFSEIRDALKDMQREANRNKIEVKVQLDAASRRVVQTRLDLLGRNRRVLFSPELNDGAVAKVATTLAALSGARSVGNIGSDLREIVENLDKSVPKIGAWSLALANLGSVALTSTANLFSLGASLASIAPAALALPGIFGGLAIGVTAFAVSMKDFNKHVPEFAVGLGRSLKAGEAWKQLQDKMSNKFWAGAEEDIQRLVNTLFPQFSRGMQSISTDLGTFTGKLAKSLTGGFNGELQSMFDDLGKSIRVMSRYTDDFAGILAKLGQVGAGNLPKLAGWFGDIADQFNNWLASKGRDGLQQFIDVGIANLKELGGVVVETSRILAGLADAAQKAGSTSLSTLHDSLKSVADTVNGRGFQQDLAAVFENAHTAMEQISKRSGPEFKSFMDRLADTLTNVLPSAGRALGDALGGIFDALDQPRVQKSVEGLFDSLETSVNNLAPSLPGVAKALAGIVDVIGSLAGNVSNGLGHALDIVAPAVSGLSDDLQPLIKQLGILFDNLITTVGPTVGVLADSLGSLSKNLAKALAPLNNFIEVLNQIPGVGGSALSNLTTIGLLVGGTAWLGTAVRGKVLGFADSMLQVATKSPVAQGAMLNVAAGAETMGTKMTVSRGLVAGLGLAIGELARQAGGGNDAVSTLSNTLEGAAVGFGVGGPVGAAIGGFAGLVATVSTHMDDAAGSARDAYREIAKINPVDQAKKALSDLKSTLDQVTGAYTGATRAAALQKLADAGLLDIGAKYGISARAMVNAALGQRDAMSGLAPVVADVKGKIADLDQAQTDLAKNPNNFDDMGFTKSAQDQYNALEKQKKALEENLAELKKMPGQLRSMGRETREAAAATTDYSGKLKGLPKAVKTEVGTNGLEPTAKAIADLLSKYNNIDKRDIRTLIQATGADTSAAKVQHLINQINALHDKTVNVTVRTNHIGGVTSSAGGHSAPVTPRASKQALDASAALAVDEWQHALQRELAKATAKTNALWDSLWKKFDSKKQRAQLKAMFGDDMKQMDQLQHHIESLQTRLDDAQNHLQNLLDQQAQYKQGLVDSINATADPTQLGAFTFDGIVRGMTKAAQQAQQFQGVIQELIKQGLNPTTLQQILSAGPQAGLATAQAILSGGVSQINDIQAQIQSAAEGVGTAASQTMFGGLISDAQNTVNNLIKQLTPLQNALRQFAHDLISALRDQLDKEAIAVGLGNNDSGSTWHSAGGKGGKGGKRGRIASATPATSAAYAAAAASNGQTVVSSKTLIYNAAPNNSLDSEDDLFTALGKAGGWL